ncbi:MAG: mannose-6-phosphate isomerase, class I [Actinomycetaceae bacterium]|nr:mannose-6-phosphate isomerase, class I [Actinomycetaceae bacterium]
MKPTIRQINGFAKHYDWGDLRAIHKLRGTAIDGEPLAEIWFGTHRDGPSTLEDGTLLEDVVAPRRPEARVDGLPYLVKLIAPAKPLSIQVHPSIAQAEAGFDLENQLGIAMSAENRTYKDRNHKPEMLLALTPWRALVGFADTERLVRFNEELATPLSLHIAQRLREDGVAETIRDTIASGIKPARKDVTAYLRRCGELTEHPDPYISKRAEMVVYVGTFFPTRTSLLVAALMNIVELDPGEALFTPVGTVHCYLQGVGLEVMASSSNTIRAGLTNKHIDVNGLLKTARMEPTLPLFIEPEVSTVCESQIRTYQPDVNDFHLEVAEVSDCPLRGRALADTLIVSIEGDATVNGDPLRCGYAAWVPTGVDFEITGACQVAVVTVADTPVSWTL